ncbi:Hypothetical predicted protein [Pelobates cultripes]|uniref:Uncharacterized protein n=1 Tax=Pelobates cultripes TaxID=61616 RepID=A0AAD1TNA2_PELCU|nr:Hypothetical predicted protein [Pelobates cultripes]
MHFFHFWQQLESKLQQPTPPQPSTLSHQELPQGKVALHVGRAPACQQKRKHAPIKRSTAQRLAPNQHAAGPCKTPAVLSMVGRVDGTMRLVPTWQRRHRRVREAASRSTQESQARSIAPG